MEKNYKDLSGFAADMCGLLWLYVNMKGHTMDDHGIMQQCLLCIGMLRNGRSRPRSVFKKKGSLITPFLF